MTTKQSTSNYSDDYDGLLDASDEVIGILRGEYPALDLAIGNENFHELRDGTSLDTYSITLIIPSLKGCLAVKDYAEIIISALKDIGSTALQSFSIICPVFDESLGDYEEQVYFSYTF